MNEVFERHRARLTAIAYGMLGSHQDAEDIVQEAWIRWAQVEPATVDEPGAFLTTVTTRLAIDKLRSARHRRETYVGPWLPEPLVRDVASDPADVVSEAEQISMALLTAFERLNPVERAVLLLREVFDYDYAEIAEIVERSAANCRQIVGRARERVGDPARSRFEESHLDLLASFTSAMAAGDLDALVSLLAADVVSWSDGGGKRNAARHAVVGAERVAAFLLAIARQGRKLNGWAEPAMANGSVALKVMTPEGLYGVMTLDVVDGRVVALRNVVNPEKLAHVR
jgi:RNA polymerase sigma-70 factor (ECF subfamily)